MTTALPWEDFDLRPGTWVTWSNHRFEGIGRVVRYITIDFQRRVVLSHVNRWMKPPLREVTMPAGYIDGPIWTVESLTYWLESDSPAARKAALLAAGEVAMPYPDRAQEIFPDGPLPRGTSRWVAYRRSHDQRRGIARVFTEPDLNSWDELQVLFQPWVGGRVYALQPGSRFAGLYDYEGPLSADHEPLVARLLEHQEEDMRRAGREARALIDEPP